MKEAYRIILKTIKKFRKEKKKNMKDLKLVKKAYTHAGCMHADDIFSAALLKLINPDIEIIRTNDTYIDNEDTIVFDIGGGKYDHHQVETTESRENGIQYAAFGKLWRDYGILLCSKRCVENIDKSFVQHLDNTDTCGSFNLLSCAFKAFNPNWDQNNDQLLCERNFIDAVEFAKRILANLISREKSSENAYNIVKDCVVEGKNYVVLNTFIPFEKALVDYNYLQSGRRDQKIEFVVYPSQRGGWNVQLVPIEMGGKEYYKQMPIESEYAEFIHKNRFLANTRTFKNAIKLIESIE